MATPEKDLDPGPPEAHFGLDPTELRDETEKELQDLRQDKARLEGQLQAAREQVAQRKVVCFEVDRSAFVLSRECLYLVCGDSSLCPLFLYKEKRAFVQ